MNIVFSVINDYVGDQRVQRITDYFARQGHTVTVIGRALPHSPPIEGFSYSIQRLKIPFTKGIFMYASFNIALLWKLLFTKADIFVANDLDTLAPNVIVAYLKGKKVIYDSHEYFTECPEIIRRPKVQAFWRKWEQIFFPKAHAHYTVNGSLASIYHQIYQKNIQSIRNLPFKQPPFVFTPEKLSNKILLYQGALNEGRGISLMIETMRLLPDYTLWIIGRGDEEDRLKKQAEGMQNVRFWGFVRPQQMKALTLQATLGFSLEEDLGGNYHYASPNKLYDYIQAGVPSIASDLPEMRALCTQYQTGDILPATDRNPHALAQKVVSMCENLTLYQQYVNHCQLAAGALCWENECGKLQEVYGIK